MNPLSSGLSEATIDKIRGVFAARPRVEKAILYGSRARGDFKKGSDIDLTLFGDGLGHEDLLDLTDQLDELLLPYTIDLSIFDRLNHANLQEHITRLGVVFYERTAARAANGGMK